MRFVTFFPELMNYHLKKDVGLIPILLKKYHKYDVRIVSYKNDKSYSYDTNELDIEFIDKKYGVVIDFLIYLIKNSKKIDVLNLYHITSIRNFKWIFLYKILNRKGTVYLKLDADRNISLYDFHKKSYKQKIKNYILKKIDLITAENYVIIDLIKDDWNLTVDFLPNGFYDDDKRVEEIGYKKNIILTVGRIGSYQKATDVLLKAFSKASKHLKSNWELVIVGEIEPEFKDYINEYIIKNSEIKNKIKLTGNINNPNELRKYYRDSKIFCLPSRYESFGLVLVEALMEGCYILTSNHESATTIVKNDDIGLVFEIDNIEELSDKLIDLCNNKEFNKERYRNIIDYAYDNFYWKDIIDKLDFLIKSRL
ncbi:glycosyltransferase family 4 protein [Clostridium sp. AL.422]|uniref:glycosyltransferase family 4 protein n=1 Tax=Clostridium TaxID=1485 RepID=UPI00293DBBC6|nr:MULTISPECIES: glycosyltransferase family 4 protein [unclassified Clostridium]MDV4150382.1 glycosyltransferase family 4 protein [Clostridium sp. AL.422]